jgi:hypothetical protein
MIESAHRIHDLMYGSRGFPEPTLCRIVKIQDNETHHFSPNAIGVCKTNDASIYKLATELTISSKRNVIL